MLLLQHAAVQSQANERYFPDAVAREAAVFPPCGVVPFRGIVMYATPMCFLYSQVRVLPLAGVLRTPVLAGPCAPFIYPCGSRGVSGLGGRLAGSDTQLTLLGGVVPAGCMFA